MALQTCPNCRSGSPVGSSYCSNCGAELRQGSLIISQPQPIQVSDGQLATPQLKALAATVAVSLAALLAEAALNYLQRRVSRMERPAFSLRIRRARAAEETAIIPVDKQNGRVITVVSERVVEEKRWGRPVRRVVERFTWRGEERNS